MAGPVRVELPMEQIEAFCRKWRITEFSLFGSVLRDDFTPGSDVDVLVTFADDAAWSLWDVVEAEQELQGLFGRPVDLVERPVIEKSENWIRRRQILNSARTVYAR